MQPSEITASIQPPRLPETLGGFVHILRATQDQRTALMAREDGRAEAKGDGDLDVLAASLEDSLRNGRGAAIVRGLCDHGDVKAIRRVFVRLAEKLGTLAAQDCDGNSIVAVEATATDRAGRGYQRDIALRPHTDFHEYMGLACVRNSASGGESLLASGSKILAAIRSERPDLIEAMLTGFPQAYVGEDGVTAWSAPLFVEGEHVAVFAHRLFYKEAARQMGVPLPSALVEALDMIAEVSERPEIAIRFKLEPGEILFWNNFRLVHGRLGFPSDHGRLLLRAWINPWRPSTPHPSFVKRARDLDMLHELGRSPIAYHA